MSRVDTLRAARGVPQVAFAEYLKIRMKGKPVLVFEGKECPAFYLAKIAGISESIRVSQLIARGKKNVLGLRDIIKKNISTKNDVVLYFVDRDFDLMPRFGSYPDVYVTRGYAIENEVMNWSVLETFIRTHFDIADSADEDALQEIGRWYEKVVDLYLSAVAELNKTVFVCRRSNVRLLLDEGVSSYLVTELDKPMIQASYSTMGHLFEMLRINSESHKFVEDQLKEASDFDGLDPVMEWRGKYHFSFLRQILVYVADLRVKGKSPFVRAARVGLDPSHSGLFSALCSTTPTPPCLRQFISLFFSSTSSIDEIEQGEAYVKYNQESA